MKGLSPELCKIVALVDETEVVKMTRELIEFETINPPGNETACAEYICHIMKDFGLEVDIVELDKDRASAVGILRGSQGRPKLLYNGHIDVVPAGEGWKYDPFGGEMDSGKIYGRGASDMKGAVASMLLAARALVKSGVNLKGDLIITSVAGEETGGLGSKSLVKKGIISDMAVILEPTNYAKQHPPGYRIEIAQRGVFSAEIETIGRAAHAARPWLGINAIYQMTPIIDAIRHFEKELARKQHPLLSSPTMNVGTIRGGTKANVVPDTCTIEVDRRMLPTETVEEVTAEFETILEKLKREHKDSQSRMKINVSSKAFEISPDAQIVTKLRESILQVTGSEATLGGKDGATDASIFADGGVACAIFGPGIVETCHTANEYVEIEKLVNFTKIYAVLAHNILK